MSNTFRLPEHRGGGAFNQIFRAMFLAVSAIGGLVMLFFSAAFVFILIAGIAIIALIAAAIFWVRAKILGKPFGPKAQLDKMRRDMEQSMDAQFETVRPNQRSNAGHNSPTNKPADGPVIDAHQTPEGWSVDS